MKAVLCDSEGKVIFPSDIENSDKLVKKIGTIENGWVMVNLDDSVEIEDGPTPETLTAWTYKKDGQGNIKMIEKVIVLREEKDI